MCFFPFLAIFLMQCTLFTSVTAVTAMLSQSEMLRSEQASPKLNIIIICNMKTKVRLLFRRVSVTYTMCKEYQC